MFSDVRYRVTHSKELTNENFHNIINESLKIIIVKIKCRREKHQIIELGNSLESYCKA